jgi:hypothetical protein
LDGTSRILNAFIVVIAAKLAGGVVRGGEVMTHAHAAPVSRLPHREAPLSALLTGY